MAARYDAGRKVCIAYWWTCLRCLDHVQHHHTEEQNLRAIIACDRPGGCRRSREPGTAACARAAEAAPICQARVAMSAQRTRRCGTARDEPTKAAAPRRRGGHFGGAGRIRPP